MLCWHQVCFSILISWTAPLGKLSSHRRQTVDGKVNVSHRLAAVATDTAASKIAQGAEWRCPIRLLAQATSEANDKSQRSNTTVTSNTLEASHAAQRCSGLRQSGIDWPAG